MRSNHSSKLNNPLIIQKLITLIKAHTSQVHYLQADLDLGNKEKNITCKGDETFNRESYLVNRIRPNRLKALLRTNVLNDVTAAPFSVSFFTAGS